MSARKLWLLVLLFVLVPHVGEATEEAAVSPLSLEVVLSEKMLHVRLGEQLIRSFPVAIGAIGYPTPEGEFLIEEIIWNPWWYPPQSEWAKGLSPTPPGARANPMRVAKIPFHSPYYYIHGTDQPESLGKMASRGCVRVSEATAEELGKLVMRWGGLDRSEGWYGQLFQERKERKLELVTPVRMTITLGDEIVYPGYRWVID